MTGIAGTATIEDNAYYLANAQKIIQTREWVTKELESLGFTVLPSKANFIFAKSDKISGLKLYQELKEKGVLIRHFEKPRIQEFNRITIGTMQDMQILIDKIKELL